MALPRSDGKRHNGARRTALLYALAALVWFIIGIGFVQILATDPLTGLIGATLLGVVTTAAVYFYASRRRAAPAEEAAPYDENAFIDRLLKASPLGIVILDADGRISLWNDAAEAIFGWTEEEVRGKRPPALEGDGADEIVERLKRGEMVRSFRTRRPHKGGGEIDVNISAAILWDEQGNPTGAITIAEDITERLVFERQLRISEERLRAVFESTHTAFALFNPEGQIVIFNQKADELIEQVLGVSLVFGDTIDGQLSEEQRIAFRDILQRAVAGEVVEFTFDMTFGDRVGYFEQRMAPVRDEHGEVSAVLSSLHDLTSLINAERDRDATELRFETLFQNTQDEVLVYELSDEMLPGRILEANDTACRLLKYDHEELVGMRVQDIVRDDAAQLERIIEQHHEGEVVRMFSHHAASDGEIIPVEVIARRIELDGRTVGISTARDIREQRRMEEALRKSEAEYRMLFAANPRPMWVFDTETYQFLRVNDAAIRHYGYSEAEFLAMTILDIRPDDEVNRLREYLAGSSDARRRAGTWLHRKEDGSIIEVNIDSHNIEIDGRQARLVLALDVTETNRISRENLRYTRELKRLSMRLIKAQEAERRHIARELHDEAGAMLTSIQMCLSMARDAATDDIERTISDIREAQDLTSELSESVRRLTMNLRPDVLDDLGLRPAVEWFVSRYRRQTGIEVEVHAALPEGLRYAPEVETAAYRIIQEALTNVARHADTTTAVVSMETEDDDNLRIDIVDRGRGFNRMAVDFSESSGLANMRERARLLGGITRIWSEKGEGTRISVVIPTELDDTGV